MSEKLYGQAAAHYRDLIWQLLDWDRVEERLAHYPHICRCFPVERLKRYAGSPPYYCHFLAWRLGVWNTEDRFAHLEWLLGHAATLPGWGDDRYATLGPEYEHYFGMLWELQVAKSLADIPRAVVQWLPQGPDLAVTVQDQTLFVECTTYRKSFGVEAFVEDVLMHLNPCIKVTHGSCMKFSIPHQGSALAAFLDGMLMPFLNLGFVNEMERRARRKASVVVPVPASAPNFYVYFSCDDIHARYDVHTDLPRGAGDTDCYLKNATDEIAKSKANANDLHRFHPNLVAANVLLSPDFQRAADRTAFFGEQLPCPQLEEPVDALLVSTCGINSLADLKRASLWRRENSVHPLLSSWLDIG